MEGESVVYWFRDSHLAPAGNTVVSVAPRNLVVSVYGGGDLHESGGLSSVLGGVVIFRSEATDDIYLGVWGARNASRFRSDLRRHCAELKIVRTPPPARLSIYSTAKKRPKRTSR